MPGMTNLGSSEHFSFEYDPHHDSNGHALIGVSPFNGYFSVSNMEKLFAWARDNFRSFDIFTMDGASRYNLMAIGYGEDEAIRKTKKQDQHLQNKIIRCLESIGFNEEESRKKIILISNLYKNQKYIEIYNKCLEFFEINQSFREDCFNASRNVLADKMDNITPESLKLAVNYLLEELPIWLDCPGILNIPSSVFVYKDLPISWHNIFEKYGLIAPKQKIYVKCILN